MHKYCNIKNKHIKINTLNNPISSVQRMYTLFKSVPIVLKILLCTSLPEIFNANRENSFFVFQICIKHL